MRLSPVLCPLDGSSGAERSLGTAIDAAALLERPLELFSAVEDQHLVARQREYLDRTAEKLAAAQDAVVHVVTSVHVAPHPPRAIADRALESDLIVMATSTQPLLHHGYFGSAAEAVIRSIGRPGMFVGPRCELRLRDVKRVVVACDGSALAEQAVVDAMVWSDLLAVPLWIVTVVARAQHAGLGDSAEHGYVHRLGAGHGAQWEVLHGDDPARALAQWADDALIVMSSHGRSGISRLTIGSVAAGTTRWANGPVLVRCAASRTQAGPVGTNDSGRVAPRG